MIQIIIRNSIESCKWLQSDLDGSSSTSRLATALNNVQQGVTQFKTIARRLGRHHQPIASSIRYPSTSSNDEPNAPLKNGTAEVEVTSNGPQISSGSSSVPAEGYQQVIFLYLYIRSFDTVCYEGTCEF